MIELFENPIDKQLQYVEGEPLTTFLCGGIVNQAGPTLSAIVAVGKLIPFSERNPYCTLPLFILSLNPFMQIVTEIGRCRFGDRWPSLADMKPLLELPIGGCPTFLLPSKMFSEEDAIELYACWVAPLVGARQAWRMIQEFPGDSLARMDVEWEDALARLHFVGGELRYKEMPSDELDARPLDEVEARKFAAYALSAEHMGPELMALSAAWAQAIGSRPDPSTPPQVTLDADGYQRWLKAISETCRFIG